MTSENERDQANATAEADAANATTAARDGVAADEGTVGKGTDGGGVPTAEGGAGEIDVATGEDGTGANGVDPSASGAEAEGDEEPSLEARLLAAEALAAAHWDRLVRLQAEMENQRKRAQRDVGNARKFALEGIAQDLLPVKDSLELGLRAAGGEGASLENLVEGSELTLKMFSQLLEKHAIVEIDPEGEKFDPEFHQAMSMQAVEGVAPNTVTGVMQKGYTLNDRLIRPALVMVSK